MSRRSIATVCAASAAVALGLWASVASAAYTQCPPVGMDTGCQYLINITDSGPSVVQDTMQGPYEGVGDSLVGVVNNSSHLVQSISLAASNGLLFKFDGDGLCNSGKGPAPSGCQPPPGSSVSCNPSNSNGNHCSFPPPPGEPPGYQEPLATNYSEENAPRPVPPPSSNGDLQNGYEGPRSWFSNVASDYNSGVVHLSPPLAPGESTYFSIEQPTSAVTAVANVPSAATSIKTLLKGDGLTSTKLIVPQGAPVTATATLTGASAASAGGTVDYRIFRDKSCSSPVGVPSSGAVTNGSAAPSSPIKLAPGIYYIQASYIGDPANAPSAATCGAAVLTVARRFNAGLPARRACVGNRLQFRLRKPPGVRSMTLSIDINGRVIRRVRVAGNRPRITLRRLPAGNLSVRVLGTSRGSWYEDSRVLRRCGK